MLSNIKESGAKKVLAKVFSRKTFHRQVSGNKGEYKNYLIDLVSRCGSYERVIVMPKEMVPNDVTLDAFNFVYQKDHSILPILLRYLTHTDLLREAKDDLDEVNQKLQSLMDKEIKKLQVEQETLCEEIIAELSDKKVNVEQSEEFARKGAKITETASRIKEIELYKEHVRNILSGKEVISRTYPKEYYLILNDELTKIMEKKLKAYVKDDEVDVEKIYHGLTSKAKKILLLEGVGLSAQCVSLGFFVGAPFVQFLVGTTVKVSPVAYSLYAVATMVSVAATSLVIAGVAYLVNRHYKKSFAKEMKNFIEGPVYISKATNTENGEKSEQKETKVGGLIDFSCNNDQVTPPAPLLEEEKKESYLYPNLEVPGSLSSSSFFPSTQRSK